MPLPWLIGAAVVAAVTAVAKAVSDDSPSSTSSSNSGAAERREQEREAELRRKREHLETRIVNLKRNRLESARTLLARAAEVLGKRSGSTVGLTVSKFEEALKTKAQATSDYAKVLSSLLSIDGGSQGACTGKELDRFRVNLRALDSLYSTTALSDAEREDLAAFHDASNRLERLQRLKNEIEQQV